MFTYSILLKLHLTPVNLFPECQNTFGAQSITRTVHCCTLIIRTIRVTPA